ncbi:sperm-associated antigen 7 [Episyrphus balteatus]|uniref:sperm-associated antigen 7 n=1 Tax=Episyrphus balteatus TaxID=286459 RepID=UPI002486B489|nr:sperm-associated antigen 7 [Episyrphus balteatus]
MDLLNSILNSMDKPPAVNEKDRELIKKQKEHLEKMKIKEKEEINRFRKYAQDRIDRFSKDERRYIEFEPMDKVYRGIIHEVAEVGGLVAISFGIEGHDRYSVVYKREFTPSEDEVKARRNGCHWNEKTAKEYAKMRLEQKQIEVERRQSPEKINPTTNYKDKYAHLIGQEAALEAARKTETNESYGFVPSKNKKDLRSIEQTMADIQAKKRLKIETENEINK